MCFARPAHGVAAALPDAVAAGAVAGPHTVAVAQRSAAVARNVAALHFAVGIGSVDNTGHGSQPVPLCTKQIGWR